MAFNLTSGQWYTAKYRYSYTGESGTARIAEIHEDGYDNTVGGVTTIVASGRGSVATRYEVEGDDEYAPFRPSTTTLSFFDTNGDLVADLLAQLNDVADKYAIVLREGDTLDWIGLVEPQNIEINEQGPVAIKIEATCGLKRRLDEAPYIDDPSSTYTVNEGSITLVSAIAKMLGALNYGLDFYVAGTIKPRASTFTALDGDEKCPLQFIWTNELAFTSGTDNEYGVISNKAALKSILEAFGMSIVQSGGAWHLTQVNLRHGGTYRRWAFDSDGLPVDLGGGDNFETFEHRVTISDEDLESTLTRARFARAYSSVIAQYQHGKVRYVRRPGFQVGTIQEAENLFAGDNPWVTSGTAAIRPFINDDLACRIDVIDGDVEGTTGYADVSENTSEIDEVYGNANDSLSAFTTLVNSNDVEQETASVYAGTTLRFFASMYCDSVARQRTRPDFVLFKLKHNGDNKYAYFKTDGSLGWQSTANWCVLKNMAQKDDWTLLAMDFSDATAADGTITITMGPLFEDQSGYNVGDPASFEYLWWDNVDLKPILADGEKDTEATSVVNFVNGARANPYPRTVVTRLGDGPSAANRTCLFTDIALSSVTGNWEQTAAAHGDTATGESLARIVGAAMLKSMNQFRRVRSGGYPGRGDILTPLQTINSSGNLYVPLELDVNWATEITGGSWYLANEQAFTSDLVEGISTGFSGFTNRGNGQSSTAGAFLNRIGSSFDTLMARESDRLGTVGTAATSGVAVVVAGAGLSSALEAGDPVFFQSKKTGYVMKRIVATYTDVNNFTVTAAFSEAEPLGVGDAILPGSISGLRIDLDGVSIVNTHLKNDGTNAWDGTVDATGAITAAGTQGWIITRTGEAEFNDVTVRGSVSLTSASQGIAFFTDAGAGVGWNTIDDVPNGATYGRVLLAGLSGGQVLLSQVAGALGDIADGGGYSKVLSTSISAGRIILSEATGDLDDVGDGSTYARVLAASISAGQILLAQTVGSLDDISDGSLYSRVLSTDISAGKILISEALGDLDDISDGTIYGRVNQTILAAGYIQVGSGTKDSTLNGFHIDNTEIVGQAAGVDQVILNTSGQIVAAAGDITLDASGLVIDSSSGANLTIKAFGTTHLEFLPVPIGTFDVIEVSASDIAFHTATGSAGTAGFYIQADGFYYANPTVRVDSSTDFRAEGPAYLDDTVDVAGAADFASTATFDDDVTVSGRVIGGKRVLKTLTSDVTVTNSTTATTILSDTLSAGDIAAGDVLVMRASGTLDHSTTGSPFFTIVGNIGAGAGIGAAQYLNTSSSSSGFSWVAEIRLTMRSATSVQGYADVFHEQLNDSSQTRSVLHGTKTVSSVDSNSSAISLSMNWGVANVGNTLTCKEAQIWIESPNT